MAYDALGDAAEEDPRQAFPTVSSDDDRVVVAVVRDLDDRAVRFAGQRLSVADRDAFLTRVGDESFQRFMSAAADSVDYDRWQARASGDLFRAYEHRQLPDVDNVELGAVGLRQGRCVFQRDIRGWREVDWDEDLLRVEHVWTLA
jgi:hypothetical protein